MESIIALQRNRLGEIINFQTSEGRIISYLKAVQEVNSGILEGIELNLDINGETYLVPTNDPSFDEYPQIY